MKFTNSVLSDIPQIQEWINMDSDHCEKSTPEWWLTGSGVLSFCLQDDKGPLCYVRLDAGERMRLHTQFAPREEVSKLRLVKGMLWCIPKVVEFADSKKAKGVVFSSKNQELIDFMQRRFAFIPVDGDDYAFDFEVA
jgi:hypothetical protein